MLYSVNVHRLLLQYNGIVQMLSCKKEPENCYSLYERLKCLVMCEQCFRLTARLFTLILTTGK